MCYCAHRNLRRSIGDWKALLPLAQALDQVDPVKVTTRQALKNAASIGTEAEALAVGPFEAWTSELLSRTAVDQTELTAQLGLLMPFEYCYVYEALANLLGVYRQECSRRLRCMHQVRFIIPAL